MSIKTKLEQIDITTKDLRLTLYSTLKTKGVEVSESMSLKQLIAKVNELVTDTGCNHTEIEEVIDSMLFGYDVVTKVNKKYELVEVIQREEVTL